MLSGCDNIFRYKNEVLREVFYAKSYKIRIALVEICKNSRENNMEIKDLRTFLAVADAKSFLKAADKLFISRQAISKTIRHLEEELSLELFVRNQNGTMMTPAGIYLYSRASALVQEFDKLKQDTMDMNRSYRPTIHLYLSQALFSVYAPSLLEYGRKYSQEMDLQIRSCFDKDVESLLADRKADAVISFNRTNDSMTRAVQVGESQLMLLVNRKNRILKSGRNSFGDYSREPMLLYTAGLSRPLWWFDYPKSRDIICSDLNYLFMLLENDKGVVPIPEISIPSFIDFAEKIPSPASIAPSGIFFSTLHPEHYALLSMSLLDTMQKDIFG